jgi:FeS assembly SUF system protein
MDPSRERLKEEVIAMLHGVYDPEIPVDIYELGLIYDVDIDESNAVRIVMTLTSPMCPVAESLPMEVENKARAIEAVTDVKIDLVWDPPWNPGMMSEAARLELGM